jgi:hypothetical protein
MDLIGTKKVKNDSFSEMCERILSEKNKLREGFNAKNLTKGQDQYKELQKNS